MLLLTRVKTSSSSASAVWPYMKRKIYHIAFIQVSPISILSLKLLTHIYVFIPLFPWAFQEPLTGVPSITRSFHYQKTFLYIGCICRYSWYLTCYPWLCMSIYSIFEFFLQLQKEISEPSSHMLICVKNMHTVYTLVRSHTHLHFYTISSSFKWDFIVTGILLRWYGTKEIGVRLTGELGV